MNVLAYCTLTAAESVFNAGGVVPITSPPMDDSIFSYKLLEKRDLIYFRLHEFKGFDETWFGDDGEGNSVDALSLQTIMKADLNGAIVIVANCYGSESRLASALKMRGAKAVLAAPGTNYAASNRVIGFDLLYKWILRGLRLGLDLEKSIKIAKIRLRLTYWRKADKDALNFEIL